MVRVLDLVVSVVLFGGFVFLTVLVEAGRWLEGELISQPPPPPPEPQRGRFYY